MVVLVLLTIILIFFLVLSCFMWWLLHWMPFLVPKNSDIALNIFWSLYENWGVLSFVFGLELRFKEINENCVHFLLILCPYTSISFVYFFSLLPPLLPIFPLHLILTLLGRNIMLSLLIHWGRRREALLNPFSWVATSLCTPESRILDEATLHQLCRSRSGPLRSVAFRILI